MDALTQAGYAEIKIDQIRTSIIDLVVNKPIRISFMDSGENRSLRKDSRKSETREGAYFRL